MTLISTSCNETVDVNTTFIRKHARDNHLPGSFNRNRDYETKLPKQQEIICSREYGMTTGGEVLPTTFVWQKND